MEKDKVYISGAIAHYNIDERKGAFLDAENRLRAMGFVPVNPFKNGLPDEAHWREHMRADIRLLLDCNFIYMLQGWELSKGAKLELDVPVRVALKYCLNNLLIVNIWKKNRKFRSYLNLTVPSMTRISFDESKKTEEVEQIWNTMSGEPVVADIDLLEEDS